MADFYTDQAAGLRRLMGNNSVQVITLAAGCRGIGRSTLLANFAVRLARLGRNVLIINTNNTDSNENENENKVENKEKNKYYDLLHYFGHKNSNNKNNIIISKNNITNLVEKNTIISVNNNVYILSAHKLNKLQNSDITKYNEFIKELNNFNPSIDTILIDGYIKNNHFLPFILASQETILLVSTTADSVSKIYHLAKQISEVNKISNSNNLCFHLLVNQVKSPNEAHFIFDKLAQVIQRRNIASLQYLGYLAFDSSIKHSAKLDEPYIIQFPNSPFSQSINHLANTLQTWQHQQENNNLNIIENNNKNTNNNKYFPTIADFFNYLHKINIKI